MPYKVYKTADDNRNHTCGFLIPNGGWYHIVELTFENHQQLTNVGNMPGYSVDRVTGNIGMFDPDGNEVDPSTIEVDKVGKQVLDYETVNKSRGGKESPVKANVKDVEREEVIEQCQRKGLRVDQRWSTQKMKALLAQASRRAEPTLGVS